MILNYLRCFAEWRIVLCGSSSSLTARQRGNGFIVYNLEGVPQARLQLFSCLLLCTLIVLSRFTCLLMQKFANGSLALAHKKMTL